MSDHTQHPSTIQKPKQLSQLQLIIRTQYHSYTTEQFFCLWNHYNHLYYKKHLPKNMLRTEIIALHKTNLVYIKKINCSGQGVRSPADTI